MDKYRLETLLRNSLALLADTTDWQDLTDELAAQLGMTRAETLALKALIKSDPETTDFLDAYNDATNACYNAGFMGTSAKLYKVRILPYDLSGECIDERGEAPGKDYFYNSREEAFVEAFKMAVSEYDSLKEDPSPNDSYSIEVDGDMKEVAVHLNYKPLTVYYVKEFGKEA